MDQIKTDSSELNRRDFYAKLPVTVRSIPALLICGVLLIPLMLRALVWTDQSTNLARAFSAMSVGLAFVGLIFTALLLSIIVPAARKPIPVLTLDPATLATPLLKTSWKYVRYVSVRRSFMSKVVCISTQYDRQITRRVGYPSQF